MHIAIDSAIPSDRGRWQGREVGPAGIVANGCMAKFVEVANDAFGTFEVTDSRSCTETGHGHDSRADINSPQRYCPLHGSNEGLVFLDVIKVKEVTGVKLRIVAFL